MKPNLRYIGSVAAALLIGAGGGATLSDYAVYAGFPEQLYVVKVMLTGAPGDPFLCTQYVNVFGLGNLSEFDTPTGAQKNCYIEAVGTPQADGSFIATKYPGFIKNRLFRSSGTFNLKADQIENIEPMETLEFSKYAGNLLGLVKLP